MLVPIETPADWTVGVSIGFSFGFEVPFVIVLRRLKRIRLNWYASRIKV